MTRSKLKPKDAEFDIGDKKTLDRYNAKGHTTKGKVGAYSKTFGGKLLYDIVRPDQDLKHMHSCHVFCKTSGVSIMESKDYKAVPDNERVKETIKQEWERENRSAGNE